jgi:hypothetical protein
MTERDLAVALVEVVRESLHDGMAVELDGLGTLLPDGAGGISFIPEDRPRVFVAYVDEDSRLALRLVESLNAAGVKTWIDKQRLLPGQDWRRAIERAIDRADFFLACFSQRAIRKRGQFPYELRYALRCAERMPLDENFLIPVRLDACELPQRIHSTTQSVDLFPDWHGGVRLLSQSILREFALRRGRDLLPAA